MKERERVEEERRRGKEGEEKRRKERKEEKKVKAVHICLTGILKGNLFFICSKKYIKNESKSMEQCK